MLLEVFRDTFTEKSTSSILLVNGKFECYTLEDLDRHLEDDFNPGMTFAEKDAAARKRKVYGLTAIPRGEYHIGFRMWEKYGREMPEILGVPGFVGVFIHTGNKAEDTEGCILVGNYRDERRPDWISNSKDAFEELYPQLIAARNIGDSVRIRIS